MTKKTALITGAAKRIGAHLAQELAQAGYAIALHCNTSREAATALSDEIEARGGTCRVFQAELSNADSLREMTDRIVATMPPLAVLVNNASVFEYDRLETLTPAALLRHAQVNLFAPLLLSQGFAAHAPAGGMIVHILDQKVFNQNPDYMSYTASKTALAGMVRPMAQALLEKKIRVCGIAPGIALPSPLQNAEEHAASLRHLPDASQACSPTDIARALRFLLDTPSINGQILTLDGGEGLSPLPRDIALIDKQ